MSENKRFKVVGNDDFFQHIEDTTLTEDKHEGSIYNIYQVVKVLNSLHEENEQLKARIKYLERKIQRERTSAMKQHEKWEKELEIKTEKEMSCGYCKYLQIDGMFGMWCDKDRDWVNTDAKYCSDYER